MSVIYSELCCLSLLLGFRVLEKLRKPSVLACISLAPIFSPLLSFYFIFVFLPKPNEKNWNFTQHTNLPTALWLLKACGFVSHFHAGQGQPPPIKVKSSEISLVNRTYFIMFWVSPFGIKLLQLGEYPPPPPSLRLFTPFHSFLLFLLLAMKITYLVLDCLWNRDFVCTITDIIVLPDWESSNGKIRGPS